MRLSFYLWERLEIRLDEAPTCFVTLQDFKTIVRREGFKGVIVGVEGVVIEEILGVEPDWSAVEEVFDQGREGNGDGLMICRVVSITLIQAPDPCLD